MRNVAVCTPYESTFAQSRCRLKKTILNPIINDTVTFVRTCAESNGRITDIEVTLMPKGRNVLHCHAYTEKFTAIDGYLGLENEKKQQKILKTGESHTVEPMAWHCFFNPTDCPILGQSLS